MKREDCPTCTALARGKTSFIISEDASRNDGSEEFAPEFAKLAKIGGQELRRCPDCGTLYLYDEHYEYDAYGPSEFYYSLRRLGDAVPPVIGRLLQPLDRPAFDAALADARRGDPETRLAAAHMMFSAARKKSVARRHRHGAGRGRAASARSDVGAEQAPNVASTGQKKVDTAVTETESKAPPGPQEPPPAIKRAWAFESTLSLEDMKSALDERSSSPWVVGDSARFGDYLGQKVPPDAVARIYAVDKGYVAHLASQRADYPMLFAAAEARLLSEILPAARAENVRACEPLD